MAAPCSTCALTAAPRWRIGGREGTGWGVGGERGRSAARLQCTRTTTSFVFSRFRPSLCAPPTPTASLPVPPPSPLLPGRAPSSASTPKTQRHLSSCCPSGEKGCRRCCRRGRSCCRRPLLRWPLLGASALLAAAGRLCSAAAAGRPCSAAAAPLASRRCVRCCLRRTPTPLHPARLPLVCSAAGRGLNLQSSDTVVIYDPDPNPKNEEQAIARWVARPRAGPAFPLRSPSSPGAHINEGILRSATPPLRDPPHTHTHPTHPHTHHHHHPTPAAPTASARARRSGWST